MMSTPAISADQRPEPTGAAQALGRPGRSCRLPGRPPSATFVRFNRRPPRGGEDSQNAVAQHEHAFVIAGMAHGALEVEDGPQSFERAALRARELALRGSDQSPALGAEQRLHDDIVPQGVPCLERVVGRLAGPGVGGTGTPAPSRSARARNLSTAASTARAEIHDRNAARGETVEESIRKTTCSSVPGGIIRTSTPAVAARSIPDAATRCGPLPAISPLTLGNGTAWKPIPSLPAARCRSWTCQPKLETESATSRFMNPRSGGRGAQEGKPNERF